MQPNAHDNVLVIGYGNSLRRDDGAGLLLAEALVAHRQAAGLPVAGITVHQLMPELAAEIAESQARVVLFVDTFVATFVDVDTVVTPPYPSPDGGGDRPSVDDSVASTPLASSSAGEINASIANDQSTAPSPIGGGLGRGSAHLTRINQLDESATLGHHLNPATLLLYAAQLYDAHPVAWILQTPGYDFDHGDGLSPQAQAAVDHTIAAADDLWKRTHAGAEL